MQRQLYNVLLVQLHAVKYIGIQRVLRGSLLKCMTRNPGVLGSSRTEPSEFFGQDTSQLQPCTGETQERHELCELSP